MGIETWGSEEQTAAFQIASTCACANLRKTARAVSHLYDKTFRPVGLRATQFALLVAVRLLGPVTVNRLAEAAIMDRTTLTRNLRPLEREGWVQIERGREDRRLREVSLSAEGRTVLSEAMPLWREAQTKIADGMGRDRLEEMVENLTLATQAARGE